MVSILYPFPAKRLAKIIQHDAFAGLTFRLGLGFGWLPLTARFHGGHHLVDRCSFFVAGSGGEQRCKRACGVLASEIGRASCRERVQVSVGSELCTGEEE